MAVKEVLDQAPGASVELVQIDVSSDESVKAAADSLGKKGIKLNAVVNNAGRGLSHGATVEEVVNVNAMGPKRVVDAFLPLLTPGDDGFARIVNVGSGAGPMYLAKQEDERKKMFCDPNVTLDEWTKLYNDGLTETDKGDEMAGYGFSKALLALYTLYTARTYAEKKILSLCLSPGYIATSMTKNWGGGKSPEEGTISLRHCLFKTSAENNGWFYGSDAERSPLHFLRNPGEPSFDGVYPWDKN